MQDNRNQIDEKLTDRGWDAMKQILDKEMPVEKPERRSAFWWWLAGAGIAASLMGIWLIFPLDQPNGYASETVATISSGAGDVSTPATGETAPEKGVAEGYTDVPTASVTREDTRAGQPASGDASQKPASDPGPESVPLLAGTTGTTAQSGKQEPPSARTDGQPIIEGQESLPSDPMKEEAFSVTGMDAGSAGESKELPPGLVDEKQEEAVPGRLPVDVDAVATRSLTALSRPDISDAPQVDVVPSTVSSISWRGYLAGMAWPGTSGSGVGGGVMLSRSLGNGRVSLVTGLGYSFIQQPLTINGYRFAVGGLVDPNTEDLPENNAEVYVGTGESRVEALSNSNVIRTSAKKALDLHYLDIPLGLGVRWNRFYVQGGIQSSILLASYSEFTQGGLITGQGNDSELVYDYQNEADLEIPVSGKASVAPIDLAVLAGTGYNITPRLSLELMYRGGFTDLLPDNESRDVNRFVQCRVLFSLGK